MRAYLMYKDKSAKGFRRLINAGSGVFGKYRTMAVSYIKYSTTDLDVKFEEYDKVIDLNSVTLESVFPSKYRWLVSDKALRGYRDYLKSLEKRITEFENGKEDNLKLLVGVLFIRYVLLNRIVEVYLSALYERRKSGVLDDTKFLDLSDIGVTNQVMKYYVILKDFGDKSIDDWLSITVPDDVAKKFYSTMKRVMQIVMSEEKKN